jgi:hypothetical protein
LQVELAKVRLHEIANDSKTYSASCQKFLSNNWFSTVGGDLDVAKVHSTIIQPYVSKICNNIDKRFGDSVGKVSLASQLFCPDVAVKMKKEQQFEHVKALSQYFNTDSETACSEWKCFRNYIEKHKTDESAVIFKSLLTTDVGDSYPVLTKLAAITLACPLGTAGWCIILLVDYYHQCLWVNQFI